ncbi:MAG TPA: flagellar motor protein MotB [Bryobacteraceae bacterium]|nr:flagellar motor protein MotB [Bryobacteraceae bacterium]
MESTQSKAPVIIIRKKVKGRAAHHGGAWKVAYADFVTAMMALFIVLWLLSSSNEATKKAISGYFNDPRGFADKAGTAPSGLGDSVEVQKKDLTKLKEKLEDVMKQMPELGNKLTSQVEMTITGEGLRIELLESEKGTFFEVGNASPTEQGSTLLRGLCAELAKLKNSMLIEGHTDARPFAPTAAYTNWELSADRANAARRTLMSAGLDAGRVSQVRGYADQRLRHRDRPDLSSNRRVSMVVQFLEGTAPTGTGATTAHGLGQPSAHPAPQKAAAGQ